MKLSFAGTAVAGVLAIAGQSFAADGKAVYNASCAACHTTNGKGVMSAKGGNSRLSDADVTAAVAYMVAQSK